MTVEDRKSPWIKPGGATARALDGFLPLAAALPFVILTAVVEAGKNGLRRSRVEAEKAGEMERMEAEYCFSPERPRLITRRVSH